MQEPFDSAIGQELDAALDAAMLGEVQGMERASPLLASMAKYHLGWLDEQFQPVEPGAVDKGKRVRPKIALLSCLATCGTVDRAISLAAAIELLHNFTLVHDDIQDASPLRRHRPTVWSIWGIGQAINVGDALFAASHLSLLKSVGQGVPPETVLLLASKFDWVTIDIVGGQVMDLRFEDGNPADYVEYLEMIHRKTAAIVTFAAWAGAIAGGANRARAEQFGNFGTALGMGFQVRDDILGIWGNTAQTGKAAADDIRRQKQSLPIILLRDSASDPELNMLQRIFSQPEVADDDIEAVLQLLDHYEVRAIADELVRSYHDQAESALDVVASHQTTKGIEGLRSLTAALSIRER